MKRRGYGVVFVNPSYSTFAKKLSQCLPCASSFVTLFATQFSQTLIYSIQFTTLRVLSSVYIVPTSFTALQCPIKKIVIQQLAPLSKENRDFLTGLDFAITCKLISHAANNPPLIQHYPLPISSAATRQKAFLSL